MVTTETMAAPTDTVAPAKAVLGGLGSSVEVGAKVGSGITMVGASVGATVGESVLTTGAGVGEAVGKSVGSAVSTHFFPL